MGLNFLSRCHRDGFTCFLVWTLTIYALILIILSLPPWNHKQGRISSKVSKLKQGADPAFNLSLNPNHKLIILLTSFRGGSSFLGTLFDLNPKIQYFYEPFEGGHIDHLYKTGKLLGARSDHTSSDHKMLYLQQILHNCTVYGTPFPEKHEFCGTPEEQLHRLNTTTCSVKGWKNGASHQEVCRFRKFTVLKVIRLPVLADLLKISQIRSANIYVIHLLRNPSPLIMSRRTGGMFFMWRHADFKSVEKGRDEELSSRITWEAFNYCHDNMKSAEFAKSQRWLRSRYLQVTHTELSVNPLETASRIYEFVNETLTNEVKDYITSITDGFGESEQAMEASRAESDQAKGISRLKKTKMKKNPLEIRKNSSEVVETWKNFYTQVYYRDVMSVESQCRSIFELLRGDSFTVDRLPTNKLSKILNLQYRF